MEWRHFQNIFTPMVQRTLWKMVFKYCKSQNIRDFAINLCFQVTLEATTIKSDQHNCPNVK